MNEWIGPISVVVGIVVGWVLTQLSAKWERDSSAEKAALAALQERVIGAVAIADKMAREAAGVAHGIYIHKTVGRVNKEQLNAEIGKFNAALRELEFRTVAVRALGPSWLAPRLIDYLKIGEEFIQGTTAAQLGTFDAAKSQSLQDSVNKFAEEANALTELVAEKLGQP